MALETLGKRGRAEDSASNEKMVMVPFELTFSPDLAIAHSGGQTVVSPAKKRKAGRPRDSKNKKRSGEVSFGTKLGPLKAKRRKFGARKALLLGGYEIME